MPRESGATTGSKVATVGKLADFPEKRLKLHRRWCRGLNVLGPPADLRECGPCRDASTVEPQGAEGGEERAKCFSSKLHILLH